jgi:hypothetical protein
VTSTHQFIFETAFGFVTSWMRQVWPHVSLELRPRRMYVCASYLVIVTRRMFAGCFSSPMKRMRHTWSRTISIQTKPR